MGWCYSADALSYITFVPRTRTPDRRQRRPHLGAMSAVQDNASDKMLARAEELWEHPKTLKARRVGYHAVRGAKKFFVGTGSAAWVVGTTMLVMVMPLVFEIDREQQSLEYEAAMGAGPK